MTLTKGTQIKMKATQEIWTIRGERGIGFNFWIKNLDGEVQSHWSKTDWIEYMINTNKAEII